MALIEVVPIVIPNVARLDEITMRSVRKAIAAACWKEIEMKPAEKIHVYMFGAHAWVPNRELHDVYTHILGPRKPE